MNRSTVTVGLVVLAAAIVAYSLIKTRGTDNSTGQSELATDADLAVLAALEAQLSEFETAFRQVADYRNIRDNELQYTRGLDRHDEALITTVFWPDAQVSYGTLVGMDGFAKWANEGHEDSAAHQHHVTTLTLDIDGDTAHEEGYIFFSSDMKRDPGFDTVGNPTPGRVVAGSFATFGTGRYVNRYERRDGEWRMIIHEYVHDISLPLEAVDLCSTACLGTWDSSDISYLRPLNPLSVEERRERSERSMMPHSSVSPDGTAGAQ